jgi:hypothetical protein
LSTYFKGQMAFRKANESLICSEKNLTVSSNLHHYVQKQVKILSILSKNKCIAFFFSVTLPAHSRPRPVIQFRNHFSQTVGHLGGVISPSQCLYINTGQHKHKINAYTHQTSTPSVVFEATIPVSERAKTVHASDRAATVTGALSFYSFKMKALL